ncbi:hypothetical protein LVY74_02355 [Acinetobacter sp. ME22]|uniref:DUF6615 family protein n=1 Tax=Acinetobacter sp. ME22 TaxID=2904802 RepID=UPI001EDBBE5A|nr:DUF6615 family protein [Acinetobacter sp. ME22]MCG2572400.1 hypothetical protein [Acinetobacter sp. ME22]
MSLCQIFRDLSYKTWMQLGQARQVDYQIRETSITDFLMVELKSQNSYEVITKAFKGNEEGKNGADWEWWFLNSSGKKGIGFRVQAKIINFESNSFEQLHYKNQTYTLIESSQGISILKHLIMNKEFFGLEKSQKINSIRKIQKPLVPLYCLYINDVNNILTNDLLTSFHFFCNSAIEHFGCSIVAVRDIMRLKTINKSNKLQDVNNFLYPWHLLVCNPNGGNLPEKVWSFVKEIEPFDKNKYEYFSYGDELPEYVQKIVNDSHKKLENESDDKDGYGANIMIIKDKKD